MKGLFNRIKSGLFFATGADRVCYEFRRFTLMHVLYILATGITPTFVSTLLMRVSMDANVALKYNLIQYIFLGTSMLLAAKLLHRYSNKTVVVWGVAMSMLVYALIFVFMDSLDILYPLVALVHGAATGFYWITYHNSLLVYCTDDNRDVAMNFIGIFTGVVNLFMPLFSGYVINLFDNFLGYYLVFGFCFLIVIVTVWRVVKLPSTVPDRKPTQFRLVLRNILTKRAWLYCMMMNLFMGIREGAFGFFLNVLLFSIIRSEALVGFNNFLVGVGAIFASMIAGRITRPNNRMKLMLFSITALGLCTAILFLQMSALTVIILSVATTFLCIYMLNPVSTGLYRFLDVLPNARELQGEILSVNECFKCAGRIMGIALIILMPSGNFWSVISLLLLIATQFVTAWLVHRTTKECARIEAERDAGLPAKEPAAIGEAV